MVADYLRDEVDPSFARLRQDGFTVDAFAYPFGARTSQIGPAIGKRVKVLRSVAFTEQPLEVAHLAWQAAVDPERQLRDSHADQQRGRWQRSLPPSRALVRCRRARGLRYGQPMAPGYRLAVFDLYGTLLDISGLAARLSEMIGNDATAMLAAWRTAQLERTWDLNRLAAYEPFDRVTAWALARVAPELDEALRARLVEQWLTLPAYGDAPAALRRLAAHGMRTAVLSNGTRPMVERALGHADLAVDDVRSVDELRVYKPDPRVYAMLDAMAPIDATLFVSSNAFDAEGAKRTGRRVGFIARGGARPGVEPDLEVRSLAELAGRIAP